jgi:hypothetical protein
MADEVKGPAQSPPAKPAAPTLEDQLKMSPEDVFKLHGIKAEVDTVIDVYEPDDHEGRALEADIVKHFGGEQGFATASAELREAVSVMDPEGKVGAAIEKMTRVEEAQAVKEIVQEWRDILGSAEKSQAVLSALYEHPGREPGKSYFAGRASEAVNEAVAKLWQSTHGEPVTGRPKSRGDGFTY